MYALERRDCAAAVATFLCVQHSAGPPQAQVQARAQLTARWPLATVALQVVALPLHAP